MRYTLARQIDPSTISGLVTELTGITPELNLSSLFELADFSDADPVASAINAQLGAIVRAAFTAGLTCGLTPAKLLIDWESEA